MDFETPASNRVGESSAAIRARVEQACAIQREPFSRSKDSRRGTNLQVNADMGPVKV